MNLKHTKILATVAVVALLGVALAPSASNAAAVTPTVNANLTTNSAITVTDGVDMGFGTWFLIFRNADLFNLHMATTGVVTTVGLGGTALDSKAVAITPVNQQGTVLVTVPTGINGIQVQMQRGAITQFTDPGLTLANILYSTATEASAALNAATNVPVTVVTGGTNETVNFGGDINVTATPADGPQIASFQVSFSY